MSARLPLTAFAVAGICFFFCGCSDEVTRPIADNPNTQPELTRFLVFEVTLVDAAQQFVKIETHEICDADLAWEIDEMIDNAPDLADERTCDRATLDAIRALVEEQPICALPAGVLCFPQDDLTWNELKRIYQPRPPKPVG
jgi:hypothetical protein